MESLAVVFLWMLFVMTVGPTLAGKRSMVSKAEFLEALLFDYDNRIPPNYETEDPCQVKVKLYVNSLDSVSETKMEFTTNLIIEQRWQDTRLQFMGLIDAPYLELDTKLMDKVWVPDLFIANEKRASFHDVTVPNKLLHIFQNGSIVYKARVSITATCHMDLRKYPMDHQVCSLYIQSFAYTVQNVLFQWSHNPIINNPRTKLPQFEMLNWGESKCQGLYDDNSSTGNFTCLKVDFDLQRNIGFYVLHIYIPSILIVLISWVSFWLNQDAVPARTSLGILTVLTMTTQSSSAVSSLPKVSYIKALDIWMAMCMGFVFAAFLEYAFVNVLLRREIKKRCTKMIANDSDVSPGFKERFNPTTYKVAYENRRNSTGVKYTIDPYGKERARHLDKIARILFPTIFSFFNLIYWFYFCL